MGTKVTSSSGSVLEEPEIQKLQMQAKIFKENSLNKLNALKSTTQLLEKQIDKLSQHMNNLETLLNAETLHEMDSKSALSVIDVEIEIDDDAELIFPYEVKFDKTPPPGNVSSDFVSSDSVSSDSESETESRRSSRELEVKWFSCRAKIALLKSNNKVEGIREWGECHVEKKLVERCSHGDGSLLTAVSKPAGSDDVDYRASRQESRNLLLIGTDGSSEHMERPRTLCRLVSLLVSFEITELNDRHQLVEQPPDLGIALIIASHVLDSLDFGKGYGYSSMRSTAKWSSNKSNSCREGKEGSGVKKGRGRKERGEEEGRKMEEGGEGGRRGNRRREVGGRGEGDGRSGGEGEGRGKGVRGRREGKEG
ncbi:hypothetical protein Tco_1569768 [Tanacetum coccineum]